MVVYRTVNTVNGKFYVGKDSRNNPDYLGSGLLLCKAIRKYGRSVFVKEIIQVCSTLEELCFAEAYWVRELGALDSRIAYNLADGGQGGDLGPRVNRLLSKINSRPKTEAEKAAYRRYKKTPEHCRNLSLSKLGKPSKNKGRKLPPLSAERKEQLCASRRRAVSTPHGVFNSVVEAVKHTGVHHRLLIERCRSTDTKFLGWFYLPKPNSKNFK